MKKLQLNQNTPEWIEFRKGKIGASETPIIMGASRGTIGSLWKAKKGSGSSYENEAMKDGKEKEKDALILFNKTYGGNFSPLCALHDDHDWMMASFDGYDESKHRHVEIKVPHTEEKFKKMADGEIEKGYLWQFQHQLAVNGNDEGDFVVYDKFQGNLAKIIVRRDDSMIEELLKKAESFYLDYIEGEEIPEEVFLERNDPQWIQEVENLLKTRSLLKKYVAEEKRHKQALIDLANGTFCKGGGISVYKSFRKGTIDYSQIPELSNKEEAYFHQFRKPGTEFWTAR